MPMAGEILPPIVLFNPSEAGISPISCPVIEPSIHSDPAFPWQGVPDCLDQAQLWFRNMVKVVLGSNGKRPQQTPGRREMDRSSLPQQELTLGQRAVTDHGNAGSRESAFNLGQSAQNTIKIGMRGFDNQEAGPVFGQHIPALGQTSSLVDPSTAAAQFSAQRDSPTPGSFADDQPGQVHLIGRKPLV